MKKIEVPCQIINELSVMFECEIIFELASLIIFIND